MSLSNASNFVINGAIFVDNGRDVLQLLSQYVAQGATHESYDQDDAPKCHPDTRKQLLSDIGEWMLQPDKETGILYLHGPAGAGKSCIARSSCALASPPGFLLASFFFWQGSDERNNIRKLFTTMAYQLAMLNDDLAGIIAEAIRRNPRIIIDASARHQFEKLILEPCRSLVDRMGSQVHGAIVIDGLDECTDKEAQISVIKLLAKMVKQERFPLGFFVTSRPELHLKEVWDTEDMAPVTQYISLSDIPTTSDDIRTVLQSGFSRILNDRRFKVALRSVQRPWPNWLDVEILVERSSGQFIYAATVLKFVSDRNRNPDAQLQIVLGLPDCSSDTSPLADLDSLYREILSRVDDPARTINVLSVLLSIKDFKLKGHRPMPSREFTMILLQLINADMNIQLLIVEQLLLLPPGEAFLALNDLHSLIDLSDSNSSGSDRQLSFYHKSFRDFLMTSGRSKEFYIDIQATHGKILQSCLKLLCLPEYNTAEQHVGWLYSFFMWPIHIDASGRTEEIDKFKSPVETFIIGNQLYKSHIHLKDAFKILGLHKEGIVCQVAEVLLVTGVRRLSQLTLKGIGRQLWTVFTASFGAELSSIKESSIFIPLWVAHLKSYKMDLFTVKRALAIHAIVPLSVLCKSGLYRTGIIHELASLPEIQEDMIESDLFNLNGPTFRETLNLHLSFLRFLSNRQSSGIFHCTPEDFADAYCDIINISIAMSSETQGDQYPELFRMWTLTLKDINPAATPVFLAALKTAARDAYDRPCLIRPYGEEEDGEEEDLLKWLKYLPNPPQDLIDAWRNAFDKARRTYD